MRLPLLNGVILDTILVASTLAAVSASNKILGSKGLDAWGTVAPLVEASATAVIAKIAKPEVETRPKTNIKLYFEY